MSSIIYPGEADDFIAQWIADKLGVSGVWQGHKCFGVVRNGELIAGVLFNHYSKPDIEMHVASDGGKKWLSRELLYHLFNYVFNTCQCSRVSCYVSVKDAHVLNFDKKIGFVKEGVRRGACPDGSDAEMLGMLRSECRYLKILENRNDGSNIV